MEMLFVEILNLFIVTEPPWWTSLFQMTTEGGIMTIIQGTLMINNTVECVAWLRWARWTFEFEIVFWIENNRLVLNPSPTSTHFKSEDKRILWPSIYSAVLYRFNWMISTGGSWWMVRFLLALQRVLHNGPIDNRHLHHWKRPRDVQNHCESSERYSSVLSCFKQSSRVQCSVDGMGRVRHRNGSEITALFEQFKHVVDDR